MKAKENNPGAKQKKTAQSGRPGKSSVRIRWLVTIFCLSLIISAVFSFLSQELLGTASLLGAFAVLFAIIALGIVFDLIGTAVTAAEEKPFHSMAARKVRGAAESIWLLRNASKVSSVCNDVVGDICGIISGAAAAVIAIEAFQAMQRPSVRVIQLLLSALVAALTICGKAFCKQIALENDVAIVHFAGRLIRRLKHPFSRT